MRIDKTFQADFETLKVAYYEATSTRIATVLLAKKLDRAGVERLFGPEVARMAFVGLVPNAAKAASSGNGNGEAKPDDGTNTIWNVKEVKPLVIAEQHRLHIAGHGPLSVQPILKSIQTVKGEERVVIKIALPILIEGKEIAGELANIVGEVVEVKLQTSQLPLPGVDGEGRAPGVNMISGAHGNQIPVVTN